MKQTRLRRTGNALYFFVHCHILGSSEKWINGSSPHLMSKQIWGSAVKWCPAHCQWLYWCLSFQSRSCISGWQSQLMSKETWIGIDKTRRVENCNKWYLFWDLGLLDFWFLCFPLLPRYSLYAVKVHKAIILILTYTGQSLKNLQVASEKRTYNLLIWVLVTRNNDEVCYVCCRS